MALLSLRLRSSILEMMSSVQILAPMETQSMENKRYPVLWLLHGMSDDQSSWLNQTALERYHEQYFPECVIIMPSADTSYYTDMYQGKAYYTYLCEELPAMLSKFLPISTHPQDTFIAGLSMGGYGSLKIGLSQRNHFRAVASFSGVLDLPRLASEWEDRQQTFDAIFHDRHNLKNTKHDLKTLFLDAFPSVPDLYIYCGQEDFLIDDNRQFVTFLKENKAHFSYEEDLGYDHEWKYWDWRIQTVLQEFSSLYHLGKQ